MILHAHRSDTKKRKESRYGVRRRVRSVLKRAKKRTGVRNSSEYLNVPVPSRTGIDRPTAIESTSRPIPPLVPVPVTVPVPEPSNGKAAAAAINKAVEIAEETKITIVREAVSNTSTTAPAPPKIKNGTNESEATTKATSSSSTSSSSSISSRPLRSTRSTVRNIVADTASIGGFVEEVNIKSKSTTKKKKSNPASTYSPPIKPRPSLEDSLLSGVAPVTEIDALKGDVSAAFSMPPPPLPFTLPTLTAEQKNELLAGERVQYQSDMGREGSGFVVLDVKAPSAVVWECLLDFYSYPQTIPTVRDVQMFTNTHLADDYYAEEAVERKEYQDGTLAALKHGIPSVTRASFSLSKFRLKIAAIHKYRPHPQGDYMIFTLDPACTNVVLQNAKGVWHTESNPDGLGDEYTRVWLLCELKVSNLLPKWITDYAAKRAMPRATSWLKPTVETAAELWYKGLKD